MTTGVVTDATPAVIKITHVVIATWIRLKPGITIVECVDDVAKVFEKPWHEIDDILHDMNDLGLIGNTLDIKLTDKGREITDMHFEIISNELPNPEFDQVSQWFQILYSGE